MLLGVLSFEFWEHEASRKNAKQIGTTRVLFALQFSLCTIRVNVVANRAEL